MANNFNSCARRLTNDGNACAKRLEESGNADWNRLLGEVTPAAASLSDEKSGTDEE